MTERRLGLRLRLLATLTGAGLLCGALLGLLLLLRLRDEIARRHVASVRQELRAVAASIAATCAGDAACEGQAARAAGVVWKPGTRCGPPAREGEHVTVCEEMGGAAIVEEVDLAPAAVQSSALVAPVLASVAAGLAPAVNRLDVRLREERSRVQAQIAQLQRSNAELRAAREEITRSERLASVGRLAAGVAHEVGNPMTALIGYLAILQERMQAGRDPGDYLERIAREAARIDRILRDLLTLARPPPAELEPVDLRVAAESARALVEAQPTWTGCALEVRVPADLPPARGDAHYVVQVLLNLLINSAKAGASRVEVAGRAEGGAPILEVLDDGRGLPPEAAARLFEPFFTSGPGEGTGLGLALCHATMERFGGSIAAGPGKGGVGTLFTLRFAAWQR